MTHLKPLSSAFTRPMAYLGLLGIFGLNAAVFFFGNVPLNERLLVIGIVGLASVIPLILTIRYYVEVDFDPQLGALHVRRMFGKNRLVIPKAAIVSIQHRGLPRNTTMRLRYKRPGKKDGVFYFTLKWGASDLLRQING